MTNPFKTKKRSQLKPKKIPAYYIVRRVNNLWEMSSPFHKVLGSDLNELATVIADLEAPSVVVVAPPKPRKKKVQKKSKSRKKKAKK